MSRFDSTKRFLLFSVALLPGMLSAQAVPCFDAPNLDAAALPASSQQFVAQPAVTQSTQATTESMAPQAVTAALPSTVTIPAGTRVLMVLTSPLHTTSATAGSGLYLETLYPVIFENHVVIPVHTQVQGVVETDERPGHVKRASEFRFRFTTLIFPNNYVAPIQGALQSIPGAKDLRTRDKDGTLKPMDQVEKVIIPAAAGAVGGAIIGSESRVGIGKFTGAGLGAALGLGAVLLKRGDEINLVRGTDIEMILQAPLSLEQAQVKANARYVAPPTSFPNPADASSADDRAPRRPRRYAPRPFSLPGLLFLAR